MNLQSLGTGYIIQQAQIDAVLNSLFASVEQKIMACIEQRRLARDYQIDKEYEEATARTYNTEDDREKLETESCPKKEQFSFRLRHKMKITAKIFKISYNCCRIGGAFYHKP